MGSADDIRQWRKAQRSGLLARRAEVPREQHQAWTAAITEKLVAGFPMLGQMTVSFYWPFQREFALLIPPVGFDARGYRLGYGGGYFDRTLAAMTPQPLKIGVAFELSRMETIHPQPYDIALDFIVTERCVYCNTPAGLEEAGDAERVARLATTLLASRHPVAGFASPPSYGSELGYWQEGPASAKTGD